MINAKAKWGEGYFVAEIVSHDIIPNKNGTNDMCIFTARALGTWYDGTLTPLGEEHMVKGYFSFHPNAAAYTVKKLRAAGWTGDDYSELAEDGNVKLEGRVLIKVEQTNAFTKQDGTIVPGKLQISWINRLGGKSAAGISKKEAAPRAREVQALIAKIQKQEQDAEIANGIFIEPKEEKKEELPDIPF